MKRSKPSHLGILSITVILIALFSMSVIWPMGAFEVQRTSSADIEDYRESNPSNETDFVRQEFSPKYEQLQSVSVYICNAPDSVDTMKCVFRLYDKTGTYLVEHFFQLEEQKFPGYVKIPVNLKLEPDEVYYYTIGGVDGDVYTAYCDNNHKTQENGKMYYKEVAAGGTSLATRYEYTGPMGLWHVLLMDAVIAVIAAVLLYGIELLRQKFAGFNQLETIFKKVLYVITGAGVAVAFWGIVIKQVFTHSVLNIAVLFLGVLIAAVLLVCGIYQCKGANVKLKEGEKNLKQKTIGILRSVLLAGTILFICLHNNAMTDYEKSLYLRNMLTCFGLYLVSYSTKKEIWNLPGLLWTVAAIFAGRYYVTFFDDHVEHLNVAIRSAFVMWSMGLVVINLIYMGIHKRFSRIKNLNVPFVVIVYLFWIACIVFSNGRTWPLLLTILFTLFGLKYFTQKDREVVLEDISNGILLAFIGSVIFCLYRRPYQYFMLTRYGGIYYTVTSTAIYLCVPFCAALAKVKKNNKLPGLVLLGIVSAYMAFTASRTGIIATLAVVLFALFMPVAGEKKGLIKKRIKEAGLMALSAVLGFIMMFSATRMVPAMVGNPYYFFLEKDSAFIHKDTPWSGVENSPSMYITLERSLEMLFGRLSMDKLSAKQEEEDYVRGPLLASIQVDGDLAAEISQKNAGTITEYSNGRLEIFKVYLNNLNWIGHDSMVLQTEDEGEIIHAHNTYIQVAYDFGIGVGILFLVVCFCTLLRAVKLGYWCTKLGEKFWLPLFLVVAFGVASLFEWTYYLYIPLGFVFMMMQVVLMGKEVKDEAR